MGDNRTDYLERSLSRKRLEQQQNNENGSVRTSSTVSSGVLKPSNSNQNIFVLKVTAGLFIVLVIAEFIGAFVSHALSLLGDATAMCVSIISFLVNIYIEEYKLENEELDEQTLWVVDILIPFLTIFPLIGVSIYILVDAISRLGNPRGDVDVYYLFIFSSISLIVDSISVSMFICSEDDLFSEEKVTYLTPMDGEGSVRSAREDLYYQGHESAEKSKLVAVPIPQDAECVETKTKKNLNILSAMTQIVGDFVRATATLTAACIAVITHTNPEICDAWAGIVGSATIFVIAIFFICEVSVQMSEYQNASAVQ